MREPKQELLIHPFLARKVADHVTMNVLHTRRHVQVYPGVFAHPDGEKSLIVVLGAAPISDPAIRALRKCKHLDQYLVLQNPQGKPLFLGPKSHHTEETWATEIINALACTRDVNCVMSIFEVMVANKPLTLANLAVASGMIAAHIPFELDEVDNKPFQITLERELDRLVDDEAVA